MKILFRILLVIVLCFFVGKYALFSSNIDTAVNDQVLIEHDIFHQERMTLIGQQIRVQGLVMESYYLLGVGYYYLQDSNRERIGIICAHFPPPDGQVIEVKVFVRPVLKISSPVTLQIEVDTPIVILPIANPQ